MNGCTGGASIISGQGTTSIVVTSQYSGEICVTLITIVKQVHPMHRHSFNPVPATPGIITGPTNVAQALQLLFITSVTGAGVYNWTVPSGVTITSGVGTANISVNFFLQRFVR